MRVLALAVLLVVPGLAHAASPEAAYLAARDRDIAALKPYEDAKDRAPGDARLAKDIADLQTKMMAIVGHVAVAGFPAKGKLNLESLSAHDMEYGTLDGLAYGSLDGGKMLIVTTDGLLDAWLAAHAKKDADDADVPRDPTAAVKTETFYSRAANTDAAVVHYAEVPIPVPQGAKFAQAMLSARTQDGSPPAPDRLFVALSHEGRVFVVEETLATAMKPIAACNGVTARYNARADAADKAYTANTPKNSEAPDPGVAIRDAGELAFRACYGQKAKGSRAFAAATDQATRIATALMAARAQ